MGGYLNASLNVEEVFGHHFGAFIDRLSGTVEHSPKHVLRHWGAEDVASELACSLLGVNARRTLKYLYNSFGPSDLEYLTSPVGTIWKLQVHNLGELRKLDVVEDD